MPIVFSFFICFFIFHLFYHFSFLSHICGSFPFALFPSFPPSLLSFGSSPPLLSFGISLFVSAKLGGLEMPLPLRPASFCSSLSLASGSAPDKNTSKSPFRPENLIILTFSSPKICIYQKFCVPLHRKVRIGVPDGRKRSASGGESGGIGCPFI